MPATTFLQPFMRQAFVAAVCASLPAAGWALMPPHVDGTRPASGGTIDGNSVVFLGYSLDYADKKADAVALPGRARVATEVKVACHWEGKGDCPGCQQQKCEATVTLARVKAGTRYQITYLDTTITVTATATVGPGAPPRDGPGPVKPDVPRPHGPKPDAPKPDAPKPDAPAKPDAVKPDAAKPDPKPQPGGDKTP